MTDGLTGVVESEEVMSEGGEDVKVKREGSDNGADPSPYFYSVTAQPATTSDISVVGHFTSASDTNLIIAFVATQITCLLAFFTLFNLVF